MEIHDVQIYPIRVWKKDSDEDGITREELEQQLDAVTIKMEPLLEEVRVIQERLQGFRPFLKGTSLQGGHFELLYTAGFGRVHKDDKRYSMFEKKVLVHMERFIQDVRGCSGSYELVLLNKGTRYLFLLKQVGIVCVYYPVASWDEGGRTFVLDIEKIKKEATRETLKTSSVRWMAVLVIFLGIVLLFHS